MPGLHWATESHRHGEGASPSKVTDRLWRIVRQKDQSATGGNDIESDPSAKPGELNSKKRKLDSVPPEFAIAICILFQSRRGNAVGGVFECDRKAT